MHKINLLLLSLLLSACFETKKPLIITGEAQGIEGIIRVSGKDKKLEGNIQNGIFNLKGEITEGKFFTLSLHENGKDSVSNFIYLDEHPVNIIFNVNDLGQYPKVISNSAIQQSISNFYLMSEAERLVSGRELKKAKADFDQFIDFATAEEAQELAENLSALEEKLYQSETAVSEKFIAANPSSVFSAFLICNNPDRIEGNPVLYKKLFSSLTPQVRNSYYGKQSQKLVEANLKALKGAAVPAIEGILQDGSAFTADRLKGKITLIAFWRSLNKESTDQMTSLKTIYEGQKRKGFEVVAISFDKSEERWRSFIEKNEFGWINVCDFKGTSSVNLDNFNNYRIPYYLLIDRDLKILEKDVRLSELPIYLEEHLR